MYATDLSSNGTYLKKSNVECTASHSPGILMGQECTCLLDDGDELRMSGTVTLVYYSMRNGQEFEFSAIQERERNVFATRYLVTGRLLGEGGFGKVLLSVNQETQRQLACKIVKLDHMYIKLAVPNLRVPSEDQDSGRDGRRKRWPTKVATCFREFDILKNLSHPNIVALEKVFWSHNTIFIFQELITGGDLFSFVEFKGGRLNDIQAAVIIRQILKGVGYLHKQDIVHRDIKPDNILMTSLEDGARVVITDFGNARFLPGRNKAKALDTNKYQRMFSYVGTLEYAAPEIHGANRAIPIEEGYSKSIDLWSIGSVAAAILTGDVIFTDRNHPKYHDNPRAVIVGLAAICDLSVMDESYHPLWSAVGNRPKDFIKRLLVLEEEDRMTASEALAHPWFANESHADDYENLYQRSIKDWKARQKNVQLVERISKFVPDLVSMMSRESVSHLSPPTQPDPTHNMLQKLSVSQRWRVNTSLPSIMDIDEQDQLTGQDHPPSPELVDVDHESCFDGDLTNFSKNAQSCGAVNKDMRVSQLYDTATACHTDDPRKCEKSVGNSMSQLSLSNTNMGGMYITKDVPEDEDSSESRPPTIPLTWANTPCRACWARITWLAWISVGGSRGDHAPAPPLKPPPRTGLNSPPWTGLRPPPGGRRHWAGVASSREATAYAEPLTSCMRCCVPEAGQRSDGRQWSVNCQTVSITDCNDCHDGKLFGTVRATSRRLQLVSKQGEKREVVQTI